MWRYISRKLLRYGKGPPVGRPYSPVEGLMVWSCGRAWCPRRGSSGSAADGGVVAVLPDLHVGLPGEHDLYGRVHQGERAHHRADVPDEEVVPVRDELDGHRADEARAEHEEDEPGRDDRTHRLGDLVDSRLVGEVLEDQRRHDGQSDREEAQDELHHHIGVHVHVYPNC